MPNAHRVPLLNLTPHQELSAEQIVRVATGELPVETEDGEIGIRLQRKDRPLLHGAIALGYLKYSGRQTRLREVFWCWCDAKEIPCVSFEIGNDCLDILSTNASVENADPFVTLHFDVVTAGRPFTKARLVMITELLLGKVWNLALSPWMISAGVLPLNQARQSLDDVFRIWDKTSKPKSGSRFWTGKELNASASHTIQ
jgi:hypothetical protein